MIILLHAERLQATGCKHWPPELELELEIAAIAAAAKLGKR